MWQDCMVVWAMRQDGIGFLDLYPDIPLSENNQSLVLKVLKYLYLKIENNDNNNFIRITFNNA